MVKSPFPLILILALSLTAVDARAGLRLYGNAAVGEATRQTANDVVGSGALWQGGLSLEAVSPYALAFFQPWVAWFYGKPAFEAAAGAAGGLPIPWIRGHAWLGLEISFYSVEVPAFPAIRDPDVPLDGGGSRALRRESRDAIGPSLRLDAWRGFGALTFLSGGYPMWRSELGYRLISW